MTKKILFLVNTLSYFVSHRLEIAIAAKKKGYEVIVVYGEVGDTNSSIFSKEGINILQIPLKRKSINPFRELYSFFFICKIFCQIKPDIVHLISLKCYLYGGIVSYFLRVPGVVTAISGLGLLNNKKNWFKYSIKKLLYPLFYLALNNRNQKIIFQNSEDKNLFIKWLNLDLKKILLFPGSGVNSKHFTNLNEQNTLITVCFASRLLIDKGVLDFITAAKIIKTRGINAKFLLAGNLDSGNINSLTLNDLQNIIDEKIVEVLGYYNDIPSLFARSHIICLPSFYGEGLPKVLIEAGAACRAIVTTDTPGCRDAIIPNKSGLLVPPNNPEKLADAIQWLIEHPQERIAMGKAARELFEEKFQIEIIVKQHLEIYKILLQKKSNQFENYQ